MNYEDYRTPTGERHGYADRACAYEMLFEEWVNNNNNNNNTSNNNELEWDFYCCCGSSKLQYQ